MSARACFLIDDRGDVQVGTRGLARVSLPPLKVVPLEIPHRTSDDETLRAIKENGFVEWRAHEGHVRIRLRPSMITQQAFERIVSWIDSEQPARLLIGYFVFNQWEYEYLLSPRQALRRLEDLVRKYGTLGPNGVRTQVQPSQSLTEVDNFAEIVAYWRSHRQQFDNEAAIRHLDPLMFGRWVLLEEQGSNGYTVSTFGARNPVYVQKWLRRSVGEPLMSGLDKRYLRATEQAYRAVAAAFEPRHEEVDTMVTWPGYGRMRNRYQRLMLPFRSTIKSHRTTVEKVWHLTVTVFDPDIELLE